MNETKTPTEHVMSIALTIIGIACAFYGVTVMMVGSGSWFFAFWYVVGALFIAAGWMVHAGVWATLPSVAKWTISVVSGVLVVAFIVGQVVIASHFNDEAEPDLDCIIVLGAQVRDKGLSVALRNRLDTAYDYLVENERTICVVTGGRGSNEPVTEADAMGDYLEGRGIEPSRIIREPKATNTTENIEYSLKLIEADGSRIGIVSNSYHLFRALAIARKHGIVDPCGISAGSTPWYLPNNTARETFAIAKDFIQGNL